MCATWYEPGDTCRTDDVTGVMLGTALAPGTIVPMIVVSVQKQTRVGTVSSVQIVKSREVIEVVNKNKQPWYVTTDKDTEAQAKNRPAFFDLDQMLNLFKHPTKGRFVPDVCRFHAVPVILPSVVSTARQAPSAARHPKYVRKINEKKTRGFVPTSQQAPSPAPPRKEAEPTKKYVRKIDEKKTTGSPEKLQSST